MPADQQTREKKSRKEEEKKKKRSVRMNLQPEGERESMRSLHEAPVMKTPLVAMVVDVKLK